MTPPDDKVEGASEPSEWALQQAWEFFGWPSLEHRLFEPMETADEARDIAGMLDAARALGRSESSYAAGWKAGQEAIRERCVGFCRDVESGYDESVEGMSADYNACARDTAASLGNLPLTDPPADAAETKSLLRRGLESEFADEFMSRLDAAAKWHGETLVSWLYDALDDCLEATENRRAALSTPAAALPETEPSPPPATTATSHDGGVTLPLDDEDRALLGIRSPPPAATATEDDGPDLCVGEWIGGSGGHRTHGAVCGKPALYGRGSLYAYCAEHAVPHERGHDRVPAATATEDAELDSPPFKPAALVEFEARGLERVNRHAAATATERGETARWGVWIGAEQRFYRGALAAAKVFDDEGHARAMSDTLNRDTQLACEPRPIPRKEPQR